MDNLSSDVKMEFREGTLVEWTSYSDVDIGILINVCGDLWGVYWASCGMPCRRKLQTINSIYFHIAVGNFRVITV